MAHRTRATRTPIRTRRLIARLPNRCLLRDLWANERRDALFLYVHVPFCEMRCGFCNLFTQARPAAALTVEYLTALTRQVEQVQSALGAAAFARFAVGGGTPTLLDCDGLTALFDQASSLLGPAAGRVPTSVETSPETAHADRVALLREHGVTRLSIGVQSFRESETIAVGRPQKPATVHAALTTIRRVGFPLLNVDLMYGLPGQTVETWLDSLREALRYRPEELYLYPLYVRPLTGLGARAARGTTSAWSAIVKAVLSCSRKDMFKRRCVCFGRRTSLAKKGRCTAARKTAWSALAAAPAPTRAASTIPALTPCVPAA